MTTKQIQSWFACQMPATADAWLYILFARTQPQEYVFAFELRDVFEASLQTDFALAFDTFLASANLEVTTEDIPPFGNVDVVYINTAYVDQVGAAVTAIEYDSTCAVWGFRAAPYPTG